MTAKKIFPILIVIVIVVILIYSFSSGSESSEQYLSEIKKERVEKDNFMKNDEGSPFVEDSTTTFSPLHYFEPDVKYRINATLEPVENKKMVVLPTSDGKEKKYLEYAYAKFKLDGIENKLLILEIVDMGPYKGTLFLAFADETSARETYGAGRYLDLKKVPGAATISLDFNKAYNPYCAYSEKFSCPFPPKENVIKVAILAGEKTFY